ncbi:DUF354 domain-containing protein [Pseudodesulfovibrio thermohalotolerans]|uniref:DUF354 domain-containing protein n=1 Tax=Pseudodesulfovibrio thermohalotolerans TaxID=2880651 RepID=UPI002441B6F9|nr:DUF354 domain-containing protein [Pseudodesulfovibrio thermohalotolerans]WFS62728.1 DUF354 domain-containing protein [Pseudodesulfovibrio thermohalotolerans]
MRLLIDVNHPGQVHLFTPLAQRIIGEDGAVFITARDKDVTRKLLEAGKLPFAMCSTRKGGMVSLLWELLVKTRAIVKRAREFRPEAIVSLGSPPAAWASRILGVPHIALEDTEHSTEQALLYLPFTRYVLTSTAFRRDLGKKQLRYKGFHELAYLHPSVFAPDEAVISSLGLSATRPFSVARFVSWQATHDLGRRGMSNSEKVALVDRLSSFGKVVLTSEAPLSRELRSKCVVVPPESIHHVLAFARLYVGEGATMASESAMLGVPAIYTNPLSAGTLEAQERYGLLYRQSDFGSALELIDFVMHEENNQKYQGLRREMLSDMDDLTSIIHDATLRAIRENAG